MPAHRGWLLLLLGLPLAGCFGTKDLNAHCNDPSEYQASREVAPIAVPPNLKLPAQTSGYGVPAGTGPAPPGAACLARPPAYFRPAPGATGQPGTAPPGVAPAAAPPAPPPGPGPAGAGPAPPGTGPASP